MFIEFFISLQSFEVTMKRELSQQVKSPRISFPEKVSLKQKQDHQRPSLAQKPLTKPAEQPGVQRIKLVFLGDGSCGKTSSLISYTTDNFNLDYTPTIFDTYESTIKKGNYTVKLELWDTAGQDQYKKLRSLSYPKTDVFLICFSLVDKKTFVNAINKWLKQVQNNCPRAEIIFVGTKSDLVADYEIDKEKIKDVLNSEKIEKKISSMGYKFKLCSALTQKGLNEVFDSAIDQVLKKRKDHGDIKKASQNECQLI